MPDVTLTYFDFPGGRGEDCRIALHVAGVDFQDDRVKGPTWRERKPTTPFGSLPVLTVAGKGVLAQSNAILRFIGTQHGMHPADPWEAARHDAILNAVEDLRKRVEATFTLDDDARKEARERLGDKAIPRWASQIDAQIGDGPFLAGDALSVADLKLFVVSRWFTGGVLDHIPTTVLDGAPKLMRLVAAVNDHPGVKSWYAR